MIFKLPYEWLKEHVAVQKDPQALAAELSLHGVSVERVEHARHEFTGVVVAEILEVKPHPNADKLQIASITTGKKTYDVVCGAPNIAAGQKVPFALPGAMLPGNFAITERDIRGVTSPGMLCAASELGLRENDRNILVLHPTATVGKELTDHGVFEDDILEAEPTTNRPDVASIVGVAREVAAVTGDPLHVPKSYRFRGKGKSPVPIRITDKKRCRRFTAATVSGVTVGESPWWMQERLVRAGIRPINVIVDITNYVMLEQGQPLHAFDADRLVGTLEIRSAKKGEKFLALSGREYTLDGGELVNADDNGPVDMAGVMGGEDSGVTSSTTTVLFEVASWDPVDVRRTSRKLQLSSDASKLFEKGLSTEALLPALARAVELCRELCGGKEAGGVVDIKHEKEQPTVVDFPLSEIERVMGYAQSASEVKKLLTPLGFTVKTGTKGVLKVTVPYWRTHDVTEAVDLVEEVGRLVGYHTVAGELPTPQLVTRANTFTREEVLLERLSLLQFSELINYSLVPQAWVTRLGLGESQVLRVANPLSRELEYMRPSLLPSLVKAVERNEAQPGTLRFFELAKAYRAGGSGKGIDRYRTESLRLAGVVRMDGEAYTLYREMRGVVDALLAVTPNLAVSLVVPKPDALKGTGFAVGQTATLNVGGQSLGLMGLLDPVFCRAMGVNHSLVAFDLDATVLTSQAAQLRYSPAPRYPSVKRDMSLVVPRAVAYTDLSDTVTKASSLVRGVELFDIYRGKPLDDTEQSYALHLTFQSDERTLTAAEVDEALVQILAALREKHKVEVR